MMAKRKSSKYKKVLVVLVLLVGIYIIFDTSSSIRETQDVNLPLQGGGGDKHVALQVKNEDVKEDLDKQSSKNTHDVVQVKQEQEQEQEPADHKEDRAKYLSGLPRTYFDIEIDGVPKGRIVFALYNDTSPLAAENFRQLCTGEKDTAPKNTTAGPLWMKDKYFYRIIDKFIDQTGAGDNSIYGGQFNDDPGGLALKHDRPGLLSMANRGPNTNGGHFSIVMDRYPHMNGLYEIFGEVVRGFDIAIEINNFAKGKPDNTAGVEVKAKIAFAGQCKTLECTD